MDTGHRLLQGEKATARSVLWSAFSGAAFNQVGEFAPDVMKKVGKARNAKKARKLLGDKLPFEDFLSANAKPYELLEKYNIPTTLSLEERKLLDELDVKMMLKQDVGNELVRGDAPVKLTKNNLQHIKKHTFNGVLEQSKFLSDKQLERILKQRSFFNKNWSWEQICQYTEEAYNRLRLKGKTGLQAIEIHGDIINIFIKENGDFDTAYGIYKYVIEDFR